MSGRNAGVVRIAGQGEETVEPVAADRLIEGAPTTRTTIDYEDAEHRTFVGEWFADIGAWRVKYEEFEFCHVLEGACELVGDDGATQKFGAGDSFVIEPGFTGVWRVTSPMRKRFVIRL